MSTRSIIALLAFAAPIAAQTPAPNDPWTVHTLQSAELGARQIFVSTPASYATSKARYPVLVVLDANDRPQFRAAITNAAFLANRNAIPELIIVGIPNGKDRVHDLAPPATGATAKQFPTAGGSAALATFVQNNVLPYVRSKYRTYPSTILAGHSLGGLYALHVAATSPGVFNGIVAMSPSLWWNDSTAINGYADSIARAPATARLFATSGGYEPSISTTVARFAARLDSIKPPTLAFGHRHYPDDTHTLTPVPSLMDGLRFVFEPILLVRSPLLTAITAPAAPDSAAVAKALAETSARYAEGARTLGLPERLPETLLISIGYALLQPPGFPTLALVLFRENAANNPDSPNAFDSLGDGLLAAGDSAAAKADFRQALSVAARTHQAAPAETKKKLAALERVRR